jgi:hypothetical protein
MLVEIALLVLVPGIFIMVGPASVGTFLRNKRLGISITLVTVAIAGYGVRDFTSAYLSASSLVSFLTPFCQFAFWAATYLVFLKLVQRPPQDVAFNWAPGMFWDRVYALAVSLVMILLPASIIYSLRDYGSVAIGT